MKVPTVQWDTASGNDLKGSDSTWGWSADNGWNLGKTDNQNSIVSMNPQRLNEDASMNEDKYWDPEKTKADPSRPSPLRMCLTLDGSGVMDNDGSGSEDEGDGGIEEWAEGYALWFQVFQVESSEESWIHQPCIGEALVPFEQLVRVYLRTFENVDHKDAAAGAAWIEGGEARPQIPLYDIDKAGQSLSQCGNLQIGDAKLIDERWKTGNIKLDFTIYSLTELVHWDRYIDKKVATNEAPLCASWVNVGMGDEEESGSESNQSA